MNLNVNKINYVLIMEENCIITLLQKWLDNNDFLMYSTYNEGKSVVAERFKITLKIQIYKNCRNVIVVLILIVLDKLVDEYNNTYHHFIGQKPIDTDCSVLIEKIEMNPKAPKFKVGDRVRIM